MHVLAFMAMEPAKQDLAQDEKAQRLPKADWPQPKDGGAGAAFLLGSRAEFGHVRVGAEQLGLSSGEMLLQLRHDRLACPVGQIEGGLFLPGQ